jgi:UDP-glucose 4-epimerase
LAVNLGSGRGVSVFELAAAVERITDRKVPLNLLPCRCAPLPTLP